MNIIKSLTLVALFACVSAQAALLSTNVTTAGSYILSTNRASIYQVYVSSTVGTTVTLYDSDNIAAPYYGTNYVTAATTYRTSYATNYVTSYVGANGVTNWYTNAGMWTITATNAAATNALPALGVFLAGANQAVTYDADIITSRGVAITATTNATIVIYYKP